MQLKAMLIGWGGREDTLESCLMKSPLVSSVLRTPDTGNNKAIIELAKKHDSNFVVAGDAGPYVRGIVDDFAKALPSVKVFGPNRLAAELEGSKIFMKTRCRRWGVPTADFDFAGSYKVAEQIIKRSGLRIIKADGLCSGKGVEVTHSEANALLHAKRFLVDRVHGEAGSKIVIEELLDGDELSVMALCDSEDAVLLEPARDQKRLRAGSDIMTGGMGAHSPVPGIGATIMQRIKDEIIVPLVAGMKHEGRPYHGVLYAGIMLTKDGPKLLEVNCRFGDPETQAVLTRLDCDVVPLLLACIEPAGLAHVALPKWKPTAAVCFCGVSKGYPAKGRREVSVIGEGPTLAIARTRGWNQTRHYDYVFREDIAAGL